jgi:hypothetical protein
MLGDSGFGWKLEDFEFRAAFGDSAFELLFSSSSII